MKADEDTSIHIAKRWQRALINWILGTFIHYFIVIEIENETLLHPLPHTRTLRNSTPNYAIKIKFSCCSGLNKPMHNCIYYLNALLKPKTNN